jgi:hypothetical protein
MVWERNWKKTFLGSPIPRNSGRRRETSTFRFHVQPPFGFSARDKELRKKESNKFWRSFTFFFPNSLSVFEGFFQIYETPSKLDEKQLATQIQEGLVEFVCEGLTCERQLRDLMKENKIFQEKALSFSEKLNEKHGKEVKQKIEECLKQRKEMIFEIPKDPKDSKKKGRKQTKGKKEESFDEMHKISEIITGNFDICKLEPSFIVSRMLVLCKKRKKC